MTATADALRDLHTLHQRAKAVRDRLQSGPKTLVVRQAALVVRQADLEKARKALQDVFDDKSVGAEQTAESLGNLQDEIGTMIESLDV